MIIVIMIPGCLLNVIIIMKAKIIVSLYIKMLQGHFTQLIITVMYYKYRYRVGIIVVNTDESLY